MPGWTTYTERSDPSTTYTERSDPSTAYTERSDPSTSFRRSEAGPIGFKKRSDDFIETLEGNLNMLMVTRRDSDSMLDLDSTLALSNGTPVGIALHRRPNGFMEFIDI